MVDVRIAAVLAIAFATNAVAEDTKWAPPNVVGMPGYHETTGKPAKTAEQPAPKSQVMSWDIIAGNWKQFSGKIRQKWGQLTDDELAQVNGKREELEGMLQARYGYSKEQAQKEIDDWMNKPAN
jgi:uncharacterized protein YjbJ (UPF0337 family)